MTEISDVSTDELLVELQKRKGVMVDVGEVKRPPPCDVCSRPMLYENEGWFCLLCRAIKHYTREELWNELRTREGVELNIVYKDEEEGE